jgi:hypothetical protein
MCAIIGCAKPVGRGTKGMCWGHYRRLRRYGDPVAGQVMEGEAVRYFNAHVMERSSGCRAWPFGHFSRGYGAIWVDGHTVGVHTLACERWYGPAPQPRMEVAHSCGERDCWAGEHLRWATRAENARDAIAHGTTSRGERNGNAKLTSADVEIIRARRVDGETQLAIARDFGVSPSTVHQIVHRKIWV